VSSGAWRKNLTYKVKEETTTINKQEFISTPSSDVPVIRNPTRLASVPKSTPSNNTP
jgi:hypothetical protein